MLDNLLLSFLPLFVAFDAPGLLPLYIKFTLHVDKEKRNKLLRDSILTAFLIALVFVIIGNKVLCYLGISLNDFLIAGGILLFIIAVKDIIGRPEETVSEEEMFGVVPFGVPLLTGPAVLTTSIIIVNQYGFFYFLVSLILNMLLCGIIFMFSHYIVKYLGRRFIEAVSKVFSLIIASIAIMFIRKGLQGF